MRDGEEESGVREEEDSATVGINRRRYNGLKKEIKKLKFLV